jgi:hypothetical protein
MFCNQCGRENPDDANFCNECGRAFHGQAPGANDGPSLPITIPYKAIVGWQNRGMFRKMAPTYEDAVLTILNNGLTSKTSRVTKQLLFRDISSVMAWKDSDDITMVSVTSPAPGRHISIPCPTLDDAKQLAELIEGVMHRYTR